MNLQPIDWIIIFAYAAVILTVGLYVIKKPKTSEGYFLAGRSLKWPFIGPSLYAANISAEMFVGLAGMGYALGMVVAIYDWMAVFCMLPLILVFLPFYLKNKIYTVPEFLERRFSPGVRTLLSGFMVVLSVLTKISVSLWAASLVLHNVFGWDQYAVIWIVGFVTALYTMKGGLKAVVYTDALQAAVLIMAAIVMSAIGLHEVGGWGALRAKLDPGMFHVIKPITDPDLPWTGVFIALWLAGSFYWSMDQVIVQRVFAAKDLNEGRKGAVFCGFLKIINPFLLTLPGVIAAALFPHLKHSDDAYPTMLRNLMPHGLLGLTVAGMAAALMGHLSATYNSIATMFTRDFYVKWRPAADNDTQIRVGRIAVLTVFILGAAWAPFIAGFGSLWVYLQSVSVFLVMPFVAVFFIGVAWKRINTSGVVACVALGSTIGVLLMVNMQTHFLWFLKGIWAQWLNASILQFMLCALTLIGVSLVTTPPSPEKTKDTTMGKGWLSEGLTEKSVSMIHDYRLWLAILVALAVIAFVGMR